MPQLNPRAASPALRQKNARDRPEQEYTQKVRESAHLQMLNTESKMDNLLNLEYTAVRVEQGLDVAVIL